jgi:hypothetical protein
VVPLPVHEDPFFAHSLQADHRLRQITDPTIFRLPPFTAMGELRYVSQHFGDAGELRQTMTELQRRLYSV